jgi:hypothetical protein
VLPKVAVGRRHGGVFETSHKAFRESVEKGLTFLKTQAPTSVADTLLNTMAGKDVEVQVKSLSERLTTLETSLGESKPKDKGKDGKHAE